MLVVGTLSPLVAALIGAPFGGAGAINPIGTGTLHILGRDVCFCWIHELTLHLSALKGLHGGMTTLSEGLYLCLEQSP